MSVRTPGAGLRLTRLTRLLVAGLLVGLGACGQPPDPGPTGPSPTGPSSTDPSPTGPSSSGPNSNGPDPTRASPASPRQTGTGRTGAGRTGPTASTPARNRPDLVGDRSNAWAFAPLDEPSQVTVEGSVRSTEAWSTSKVLVVAAFLQTVAKGDPERLSAADRRLITRALSASDANALVALQSRVPRVGRTITAMLRSIGDRRTVAPDRQLGLMSWSVREQVRFLTALHEGRVVSRAASRYLVRQMRPIPAHAWGLGRIGATAYKGGWLRQGRVTRQLGIVDGYAVAIITDAVGPVERQTDGDSAHVRQLDLLARRLHARLAP